MDTSKIGILAARFMEQFDNEELEDDVEPDTIRLGELLIAGEVLWTDKEGVEHVAVVTASTSPNRIHQTGIIEWAKATLLDVEIGMTDLEDDDGDENEDDD